MATLTTMYGNAAAIRTMLRESVGHPNQTVLLPDSTVDTAITRALSRLNVDLSQLRIGTFTTVADQQAYSPLPAGAYGIINVWWPPGAEGPGCDGRWSLFVDGVAGILGNVTEQGIVFVPDPSSVMALLRRNDWLRALSGVGAVVTEENTVYLTPIPATAGATVVFTYTAATYATAGAVAELDAEPFIALATSLLHERLAGGAGGVATVSDTSEGTSIHTQAPAHHLKMAAERKREYLLMKRGPPQDWRQL